ncbi:glycosyltransferase family 2 protein [Desulfovibrio sp. OttesenSCG-928-F20]|nr:glycosyltransferase family 2 protein [Desulfovibrio sp. OttesenSCG-928-M16]MDL2291240.1 glycosyltransferase family 2 protein [Desulfovibrio sp. OttesenSCG-928-F20]
MKPFLSIIVPHRNNQDQLPRLFDSILAQNFKELEVVLVDDFSAESCVQIVESYRQKGLNIVLLEQQQRIYTLRARLLGMQHAQGEIIGFADSDDMLWGTEALGKNIALFRERQAEILHFRSVLIDSKGHFSRYAPLADPFGRILEGEEILTSYAQADFYGVSSLWNKLFSRQLCLCILPEAYDQQFMLRREDSWLNLLLLTTAKRYVGSDEVGYAYFWEEKRETHDPEKAIAQYQFLLAATEMMRQKNVPERTIAPIRHNLERTLCGDVGHMCRALFRLSDPEKRERIADILERPDRDTLLEALLLANGLNAERLVQIYNMYT